VYSVASSPDGQHIISGDSDNTIQIWDVKTGAAINKLYMAVQGMCLSVAYSPDGRQIISGSSDRPFESGIPRLVLQLANL
jgi:WD40 repeat protein